MTSLSYRDPYSSMRVFNTFLMVLLAIYLAFFSQSDRVFLGCLIAFWSLAVLSGLLLVASELHYLRREYQENRVI